MNINFNTLFQKSLPFIYVILVAFLLNSVIFFYLPKSGVDFIKNDSLFLDYKKYSFYSNIKSIENKTNLENPKQIIQTLSKYNLKAIYFISNYKGWVTIEEKSGEKSYILAQDEQIEGYKLFKLYKNYILLLKDNKEYKLEINEESSSNLLSVESPNNQKQEIIVKNNGAVISRDYLNSFAFNIDKVGTNENRNCFVVNKNNLNVRVQTDENSRILRVLRINDIFSVQRTNGDWLNINTIYKKQSGDVMDVSNQNNWVQNTDGSLRQVSCK